MIEKSSLDSVNYLSHNCKKDCSLKTVIRRLGLSDDELYNFKLSKDFDETKLENYHAIKEIIGGCEKDCDSRKIIATKFGKRPIYQIGCILLYRRSLKEKGLDLPMRDVERDWIKLYGKRFHDKYEVYEDGLNIKLFFDLVTRVKIGDEIK